MSVQADPLLAEGASSDSAVLINAQGYEPPKLDQKSAGSGAVQRSAVAAAPAARILLTAIGSRGDVQPMVALAVAILKHNPNYEVDVGKSQLSCELR
jgi:hypothetical protein